jgi:hypothetical protein
MIIEDEDALDLIGVWLKNKKPQITLRLLK